jgi:hypothetical protein
VLRNASNKCHSITVEAELKFLFILVFFSVLLMKVMIMRRERGLMRAEMFVVYCNNEYRKPLRDQANATATWSKKGETLMEGRYFTILQRGLNRLNFF